MCCASSKKSFHKRASFRPSTQSSPLDEQLGEGLLQLMNSPAEAHLMGASMQIHRRTTHSSQIRELHATVGQLQAKVRHLESKNAALEERARSLEMALTARVGILPANGPQEACAACHAAGGSSPPALTRRPKSESSQQPLRVHVVPRASSAMAIGSRGRGREAESCESVDGGSRRGDESSTVDTASAGVVDARSDPEMRPSGSGPSAGPLWAAPRPQMPLTGWRNNREVERVNAQMVSENRKLRVDGERLRAALAKREQAASNAELLAGALTEDLKWMRARHRMEVFELEAKLKKLEGRVSSQASTEATPEASASPPAANRSASNAYCIATPTATAEGESPQLVASVRWRPAPAG